MQYLVWALEEIEKIGDKKAADHARMALMGTARQPPTN
jgi:hypothetical protein